MRALLLLLAGLSTASPDFALAQMKLSPKAAPSSGTETRYFTSIDGLMEGNADVILKETRQGKNVTAAVLDVCYPAEKGSDRKDRFVANLAVNGQSLTGTTQSLGDKLPVTVKLTRKPTGDAFEFKGQISVGQTVTEVTSTDNSDLSEKEFQDNQTTDDGITPAPKDFTEVSPEAIGVKVKLEAAPDFLKGLRGQEVEVSLGSLAVSCEALRAGEQTININVDPERAAALIAKSRSTPGVLAAGWISGVVDMDRSIRFAAADWRDGDKLPARPHRYDRGCRPGGAGQARRLRPADAVDRQPRHFDGGRNRRPETQSDRGDHRRRGRRPEGRQRLCRGAGEGIQGPALGCG